MEAEISEQFETNCSIVIPIRPVSVNHAKGITTYGKNIHVYTTPNVEIFQAKMNQFLLKQKELIQKFTSALNGKDGIIVEYHFYIPKQEFLTKKGEVSKRGGDVDNYIKITNDVLFKFMGLNDSRVTRITAEKIPTTTSNGSIVVFLSKTKGASWM